MMAIDRALVIKESDLIKALIDANLDDKARGMYRRRHDYDSNYNERYLYNQMKHKTSLFRKEAEGQK